MERLESFVDRRQRRKQSIPVGAENPCLKWLSTIHHKLDLRERRTRSDRPDHRCPFLIFFQQRMQWKYDYHLGPSSTPLASAHSSGEEVLCLRGDRPLR